MYGGGRVERDREEGREGGRQTGRQGGREVGRQADKQRNKQGGREGGREESEANQRTQGMKCQNMHCRQAPNKCGRYQYDILLHLPLPNRCEPPPWPGPTEGAGER